MMGEKRHPCAVQRGRTQGELRSPGAEEQADVSGLRSYNVLLPPRAVWTLVIWAGPEAVLLSEVLSSPYPKGHGTWESWSCPHLFHKAVPFVALVGESCRKVITGSPLFQATAG